MVTRRKTIIKKEEIADIELKGKIITRKSRRQYKKPAETIVIIIKKYKGRLTKDV